MLFQKSIDKAFALQQKLNRERRGETEEAEKPSDVPEETSSAEGKETPVPPQLLQRRQEEKLTFKDKIAMLLSAYAVLLVPAVGVLVVMCLLLYWMAGGF